jgi:hypothetical protein
MRHEFNIRAFNTLTDESQQKVECIYNIAIMLKEMKAPPLNTVDFDFLYDKELDDLDHLTGYIRSRSRAGMLMTFNVDNIEGE